MFALPLRPVSPFAPKPLGALACLATMLLPGTLQATETHVLPITADQVHRQGRSEVRVVPGGAEVKITDPGNDAGLRLSPPTGERAWDLSGWQVLAVDAENLDDANQLRLLFQVATPEIDGKRRYSHTGFALNPGEKRTIRLRLPHAWQMSTPQGLPGPRVIDTRQINEVTFFMQWPFERPRAFLAHARLTNLRVEGPLEPLANRFERTDFLPFIDRFGQYAHDTWPEKAHRDADLKAQHARELAVLATSPRPADWNRFGGWQGGPQLEATGAFRVEKYQGKWYFVDPEGRLFFSHGIDVLHPHTDALQLKNRKDWFADVPRGASQVQPVDRNLVAKYGTEDYQEAFYDTLLQRLEHWGMNTIGNWGRSDLMMRGAMPYTLQLSDYNDQLPRIRGNAKRKFYDVFDPAYERHMRSLISERAARDPIVLQSLTDPMCIGYFIDNELDFGNRGRMVLVDEILKSPADQVAKQVFVTDLRVKYLLIEKLNAAWGTDHANWEALLAATEPPTSTGYRQDAAVFFEKTIDRYFALCREAIKAVAPHRLYLGTRFIGTDAVRRVLYEANARHGDVLTVNIYSHNVANYPVENYPDMPVLIGEFHFGIFDRGMFQPSLCPAGVTQADRALAYTRFLEGALAHPNIVGTHWFQFRDQPLIGRWDGEGYQLGFVDVTDTPYEALGQAARAIGESMYDFRRQPSLQAALQAVPRRIDARAGAH